tara:strand:- start:156 stop:620 length:465 start_codon:yes stop_codon:yes gene_type:complete
MRYSSKSYIKKKLDLSTTNFKFDIEDIINRLYNIKLSSTTVSATKKLDFSYLDWKIISNSNNINISELEKRFRKTRLNLPKHSKLFRGITPLTKEKQDIIVNKSFEYLDKINNSVIDESCITYTEPYEYSGYESDIDEYIDYIDYPDFEDFCDM